RGEDDRAALRHRPHPGGDGATERLPRAHAERRAVRPRRHGEAERVRRAVVTLAHPAHAGMLRALGLLDQAAAAHGWTLDYVLAAPDPLVAAVGLPVERVTYLGALRGWRRWPARARRSVSSSPGRARASSTPGWTSRGSSAKPRHPSRRRSPRTACRRSAWSATSTSGRIPPCSSRRWRTCVPRCPRFGRSLWAPF